MGFFDFLRSNDEKSAPVPVRTAGGMLGFFSNYSKISAPDLSAETILQTTAVLSAVRLIASQISSTPLKVMEEYQTNGNTHKRVNKKHFASKLLGPRGKPNNWQTPQEFIETMMTGSLLGKGALALKTFAPSDYTDAASKIVRKGAKPKELIPVPIGAWTMLINNDNSRSFQVIMQNGRTETYPDDHVVFWRPISLDGYIGVSVIESARKAIGITNYLEEQQLQLASKGGNPSGILTIAGELEADRKAKIREQWNSAYGSGGSGGIAVLDNGGDFKPVSLSLADSQFIENRKFQIEEVARVFGIQPTFLGHTGGINPDGVDAALRLHVKVCLAPWFYKIEQVLNRDLLGDEENLYFDFDERELLRGDLKAQMEAYTLGMGAGGIDGIYSVNEIREVLGENPLEEEWAMKPIKGAYRREIETSNPNADE